ncbi:tetratricopeptide repeat protein [Evansella tamaricis]|uniref:Tetratricopeptide repeat protein n=1 Tax=Evansella tamaricis TaxID=2069301 RepID=A0ABS6JM18_9BACI|nr:tetratricopeptide repeat protein [Evansella tamaricis]MBU9714626.1 tetratricopeptide repeat protein [Evansella tamaricis]
MFSKEKWDELCEWLLLNQHTLSDEEKHYWVKHLSKSHEKMLEVWSEQLDLLDEVKEKLLHSAPLTFDKSLLDIPGISYFNLGLYEKALDELNMELRGDAHHARIYLYKGFSHLYMNDGEVTKESFLNTIHQSMDPLEKHFAFLGLGIYEGRGSNIEQAISYFEKAESLLFNPDVVYNLGICYLLLEMPEQALPYFKKVIDANEGDAEGYYWLGKCYFDSGDRTYGMETWYKAVQTFDSKELLLSLAVEFEEKEFFTCSLYCYERLHELGYDEATILHGIAWNYGLMDEREKSTEGFQQLLKDHPGDINAWISYLWLLIKWDEFSRIKEVKEKIHTLGLTHPLLTKMTNQMLT